MYTYILWDLDGTIANTYEGVKNSMAYALEPFGFKLEDKETVDKFIGPPLRVSIPMVTGFDKDKTEKVVSRFRKRYAPIGLYECQLFPEVSETMDKFNEVGKIQAVSSSKPQVQCVDVLKHLGVGDKLDFIFGSTLDGRIDSKLEVLEETFRVVSAKYPDFDKSEAILIGDTKYDAIGAKEAGIDCIGVGYGFGTEEEFTENDAIGYYETLDEVYDVIINA